MLFCIASSMNWYGESDVTGVFAGSWFFGEMGVIKT